MQPKSVHLDHWRGVAEMRPATYPVPELGWFDAALLRMVLQLGQNRIGNMRGVEYIQTVNDPFILAANHSSRIEAVLLPALLAALRGGRMIGFLADWNFRMIPGVGLLYRRSHAITVPRKRARPAILNHLKPLFTDHAEPFETARRRLACGQSIGVFPEGTVNGDATHLLRGRFGAARLSLETGVPVVPVGLTFPTLAGTHQVDTRQPFDITISKPLPAVFRPAPASLDDVRKRHGEVMSAISDACGKVWPNSQGHQREGARHETH